MVYAVDAWMQHPSKRFLTDDIFLSLHRWNGTDTSVFEDDDYFGYNTEFTLGSMDSGNVKTGLICAWYGPHGPLITNEYVLKACKESNGRLRGVASADIRDPTKAVEEIRHYVKNHGFVGVRILPWLWEKYATDRLFYPIYSVCAELDIPLLLQVGQTGPMRPSKYGDPIHLEEVLLDFPTLKVVGGHIGTPWVETMIFLCTKFENCYIDTSAYKPSRYSAQLVEYMRGRGRRKVLYGSNYPMIMHHDIASQLDSLRMDDEALELFLHGNAERVFRLPSSKASL